MRRGRTRSRPASGAAAIPDPPERKKQLRHPIVSTISPPSTRPKENPRGWLKPKHANPRFLLLPCGAILATSATEAGRCMDRATPCPARKMISWIPMAAKPQASVDMSMRADPTISTDRGPITSAIAPAISRVAPDVRPTTEEGHKYKAFGSLISEAMIGSPTVTTPVVKLDQKEMAQSWKMVMTVRRGEAGLCSSSRALLDDVEFTTVDERLLYHVSCNITYGVETYLRHELSTGC